MINLVTLINLIKTNTWIRYIAVFAAGAFLTFLVLPSAKYSNKEFEKRESELKANYSAQLQQKDHDYQQLKLDTQQQIESLKKESIKNEQTYRSKISSLYNENNKLRKSTEKVTIEIRYPDGRVEKKTVSRAIAESESQRISLIQQESDKKLKETVDKLSQDYSLKISQLQTAHQQERDQWVAELSNVQQELRLQQDKADQLAINDRKFGLALGRSQQTTSVLGEYDVYGPLYVGTMIELNNNTYTYNSSGLLLGLRF